MFILMNIWTIGENSMYIHAKKVCNDFEIKNLGEYLDLHIQSDTLLLAGVFENF